VRRPRVLVLYAQGRGTETLSYYYGWPRHFARDRRFDATLFNLAERRDRLRLALASRRADAVVLLHSVYSNEPYLRGPLLERVRRMRAAKALFVGNEYKLMPEKVAFAERLGVRLLVTQLDDPAAHELYRERLGCEVAYVPYTGLDAEVFHPGPPLAQRPLDLGYRAFDSPLYLGHDERRRLVQAFADRPGIAADIVLGAEARLPEGAWADFLRSCRGQLGSEAGGDRFELTDETRLAVNALEASAGSVGVGEIEARFFSGPAGASGRALSGRVVEAAGTKTVQLLIDGRYGGFFRGGEHYVPLRRDLADADAALGKLQDDRLCADLVEAAHEVAATQLTYPRLLDRFHDALRPLL
jgi:hypothetical protein